MLRALTYLSLRYHTPSLQSPFSRPANGQAENHAFRHARAARGGGARSRDRRARDADLPVGIVRVSRQRPCGGAFQHGARGARVFAHLQSDLRRAGVGAIATASGQAALHLAIVTLLSAGSHIVASRALYGGSHNLLDYTLPRFGIATTFVDPRDLDAWKAAIRPETRLLFGETLGNPGLDVLDIPQVAALAHEHGLPLLVDSTFTTPYLMQPFAHGADLVFHSATKFLSGHGVVIGGLLVDSGAFAWDAPLARANFPTLNEPYAGFHDMVFSEESTTAAFLLRARREGVRDFGACMAPFTAFQILQGIETLPLRMARHVENARKVVAFLAAHPLVRSVAYPELPGHPDHALAARLLPRGCGAVFSFNLAGNRAQGRKFIESLGIFSHLANVGDAKSLVIHPASTTHFRMSAAELDKAGITEGTIRLSIGLENVDDLIEDLSRALHAAGKAA